MTFTVSIVPRARVPLLTPSISAKPCDFVQSLQVMNQNDVSSDVEIGTTAPVPVSAFGGPFSQWLVLNSPYGPSGEVHVEAALRPAAGGTPAHHLVVLYVVLLRGGTLIRVMLTGTP